ncbi:hypothetical protein DFO46_4083 [Rhizobium sp. AG855]|nr:hypothetical protein DFO46_4083 [Rhizobium sp. AG855]
MIYARPQPGFWCQDGHGKRKEHHDRGNGSRVGMVEVFQMRRHAIC